MSVACGVAPSGSSEVTKSFAFVIAPSFASAEATLPVIAGVSGKFR